MPRTKLVCVVCLDEIQGTVDRDVTVKNGEYYDLVTGTWKKGIHYIHHKCEKNYAESQSKQTCK